MQLHLEIGKQTEDIVSKKINFYFGNTELYMTVQFQILDISMILVMVKRVDKQDSSVRLLIFLFQVVVSFVIDHSTSLACAK